MRVKCCPRCTSKAIWAAQTCIYRPYFAPKRVKKAASILIAEQWQTARWPCERVEKLGHARETLPIRRRGIFENGMKQEHVERVEAVIGRLFEMASVVTHLPSHFAQHDFAAEGGPALRSRDCGEQLPQSVQRDGFPAQVSVRREIIRQIRFDVTGMKIQEPQKSFAEIRRHARALQVINPGTRQRPECHFERAGPVDAALERVLSHPALKLAEEIGFVRVVASDERGLRQQNQVLVAV